MDDSGIVTLGDVPDTGLLTAFCHAMESRSATPLLHDPLAEEISARLGPMLKDSPTRLLRRLAEGRIRKDLVVHLAVRARRYDRYAREFIERHGGGCVVNLGCGLDTRFWRIDDGRLRLYDLDLPATIALKKRFVEETDRYHLIGKSVLERGWMDDVATTEDGPFLFLAEGLFMYLPEDGVRSLVLALQARFPGSELVFETVNSVWLRPSLKWIINRKMQKELGLGPETEYRFGIRHERELESWGPGVRFLDEWSYLDEDEPRIGPIRWFRRWQLLRKTQWTVHYLLEAPDNQSRLGTGARRESRGT